MDEQTQQRVSDSDLRMAVRAATLKLADAIGPESMYDPAEDDRAQRAVLVLGELLGRNAPAEGVHLALTELWLQWKLGNSGEPGIESRD